VSANTLNSGDIGIAVAADGSFRCFRADGDAEKPVSDLHRAIFEAVLLCVIDREFRESCLQSATHRVRTAN
jgi:hypothetical protein